MATRLALIVAIVLSMGCRSHQPMDNPSPLPVRSTPPQVRVADDKPVARDTPLWDAALTLSHMLADTDMYEMHELSLRVLELITESER